MSFILTLMVDAGTGAILSPVDAATFRTGNGIQGHSANLDIFAGIDPTADVQSFLAATDYAAMRALLGVSSAPIDADAAFTADRTWSLGGHTLNIGPFTIAPTQISTNGQDFTTDLGNLSTGGGSIDSGAGTISGGAGSFMLNAGGAQFNIQGNADGLSFVNMFDLGGMNIVVDGNINLQYGFIAFNGNLVNFGTGGTVLFADAIGSTIQAYDADLAIWAGISPSSDAQSFISAANNAAMRTALGLGTLATQNGTFSGTHSGTSSGTNTGDQTSVSGNAGTATALATARAINGVDFNGTAAITITAAASTLTGSTLASGVTASSLTSLGILTALNTSGAITLTGTGGASYICMPYQSVVPATPGASKAELYAGATLGKPIWLRPDAVTTNALQQESRRYVAEIKTDCLGTAGIDGFSTSALGSGSLATGMTAALVGHPGIRALTTGTTTTGRAAIASDLNFAAVLLGGNAGFFEANGTVSALSDGTDTYTCRFGLLSSISAEPADGVYFRYTHSNVSGHWQGVCRAGGVETTADLTDAVAPGQYDTLRFEWNAAASSVTFFVNGVSRGTITGTIPTSATTAPAVMVLKSAGTSSRTVSVDYIHFQMDFATAR